MSPQAGWRHDHVEAPPRTGFTRCSGCYRRLPLHGEGADAAIYSHRLAGECPAHEAPKVRNPRKKDGQTNSPTNLNDWAVMFDG